MCLLGTKVFCLQHAIGPSRETLVRQISSLLNQRLIEILSFYNASTIYNT